MVVLIALPAFRITITNLATRALDFQEIFIEAVLAFAQLSRVSVVFKHKSGFVHSRILLCLFYNHVFNAVERSLRLLKVHNLRFEEYVHLETREFNASVDFNISFAIFIIHSLWISIFSFFPELSWELNRVSI